MMLAAWSRVGNKLPALRCCCNNSFKKYAVRPGPAQAAMPVQPCCRHLSQTVPRPMAQPRLSPGARRVCAPPRRVRIMGTKLLLHLRNLLVRCPPLVLCHLMKCVRSIRHQVRWRRKRRVLSRRRLQPRPLRHQNQPLRPLLLSLKRRSRPPLPINRFCVPGSWGMRPHHPHSLTKRQLLSRRGAFPRKRQVPASHLRPP